MTTKLRINTNEGILEVEGEEGFVREIYTDFKAELAKPRADAPADTSGQPSGTAAQKSAAKSQKPERKSNDNAVKKKARTGKSDEPKVDKNLDLSGVDGAACLKDFVAQYQPKTNMERNVVFIAYLKDEMNLEQVGIDQLWTCYHDLGVSFPVNMKQSIYDTSSAKSWINVPSLDALSLSVQGKNWMRDQLNKPKAAA